MRHAGIRDFGLAVHMHDRAPVRILLDKPDLKPLSKNLKVPRPKNYSWRSGKLFQRALRTPPPFEPWQHCRKIFAFTVFNFDKLRIEVLGHLSHWSVSITISAACWLRRRSLSINSAANRVYSRYPTRRWTNPWCWTIGIHGPAIPRRGADHIKHGLPIQSKFVSQCKGFACHDHRCT